MVTSHRMPDNADVPAIAADDRQPVSTENRSTPAAQPLAAWFPAMPDGAQSVFGPIADYRSALLPGEARAVHRAVASRQREHATGRVFARTAIAALGLVPAPLLTGPAREPVWPAGVVGAISHSRSLAWAAAARQDAGMMGLGVDLEQFGRLQPSLYDRLFTRDEVGFIEATDVESATLLFSAKEAIYKAVFPLAGRFIGFQEVELTINAPRDAFRARYLGDYEPNRVMEQGSGYLRSEDGCAFSAFTITAR